MKVFQNPKVRAIVVGMICLGLMTSAASAAIIVVHRNGYFIPGVNAAGNPDQLLGGFFPAKVFKDTRTGIIIGTFGGKVTNLSLRFQIYRNLGCVLEDPANLSNQVIGTSDLLTVTAGKRGPKTAIANAFCVYNPKKS